MKFKLLQGIPGLLDIKLYGATVGKYSFLIGQGPDGFTASYKDREYMGPQSSSYINNGEHSSLVSPFKSLKEAEAACKAKRKELRKN